MTVYPIYCKFLSFSLLTLVWLSKQFTWMTAHRSTTRKNNYLFVCIFLLQLTCHLTKFHIMIVSAGLTTVWVVPWEGGARLTSNFYHTVLTSNAKKTFTDQTFCVGPHVTFGLNDRHIPIQYPSWLAKGFDKAIQLLIPRWVKLLDTGIWLFCFDTLCKLAYMTYPVHNKCKN